MKKLLFIIFLTPLISFSQGKCISGDCENGVGTYLWDDGAIYEGDWKNGKLHGIGITIMYDENGMLFGTYDGEFKNGVQDGWGTETIYSDEGYLYGTHVGYFKDDQANGWGIFIWRDGTIEKGEWKEGELID
jgi:hypothetical protein